MELMVSLTFVPVSVVYVGSVGSVARELLAVLFEMPSLQVLAIVTLVRAVAETTVKGKTVRSERSEMIVRGKVEASPSGLFGW